MTRLVFEGIEQASDAAVENRRAQLGARLAGAAIALYVKEHFDEGRPGGGGLKALAQTLHVKASTLEAEIAVFTVAPGLDEGLLKGRPTLSWTHLQVLRLIKDPNERESWADRASDENWSSADLRRAIALAYGQPQDSSTVLAKVASWGERGKSVADQAEEVGVLAAVEDRVESIRQYIEAKRREAL